jgi:DNA-binding NarL/FixJ family response regulator
MFAKSNVAGEGGRAVSRILIIDDVQDVRAMLRVMLEPTDEIVGELSDGDGVGLTVEKTQPDVVIMDLKMPTVDGDEATREIKALFPQVQVVGFTSGDGESRDKLTDAGADAVFSKTDMKPLIDYLTGLG